MITPCRERFNKYKNAKFNVEDQRSGRAKLYGWANLEALLEENSYQKQEEFVHQA